ncbi:MAG: aspartate-semialdehyde dehydrogenase [Buchnera aphidicola (Pentalonia nigronervosa)]|jgi:aspartate-semialdehyde dehydrogenase|uniref:Aspartate-semialdehyde dehydrogenase n=1 Tax=Buchnera aphidicola (Pentalonia nigronervosa) TaxID=1309793 RepID=A0A7H1AYT6_9GAMM|nr:MAG: aspartate-semialdehyde dehydrogenase [Buchnera aphidicola (Pentalonia nigronervosa)]
MKKNVGFVGWRGMVGSVLINRMQEENDFCNINPIFFSTSQFGTYCSIINNVTSHNVQNAYDIESLRETDIIITCQGSEYTKKIYPELKKKQWQGYWIDASSFFRTNDDAVIILDPINYNMIMESIKKGIKIFVGSNCTVSLMLMSLGGLFQKKLVEWVAVSTYQAASGAGARYIIELLEQMGMIYSTISNDLFQSTSSVLNIEKKVTEISRSMIFPKKYFSVPLAGSLIPWIDKKMDHGQTREEWKGQIETNKILGLRSPVIIDSTCVRISSLRCHSQSFVVKLNKQLSLNNIEEIISEHNQWVNIIPNNMQNTLQKLNPISVTGTLDIAIGRFKILNIGKKYFSAFTVGDQLLWGAAEPLRRMLNLLIKI